MLRTFIPEKLDLGKEGLGVNGFLTASQLKQIFVQDPDLMKYIPDNAIKNNYIDIKRDYLFNVNKINNQHTYL